MRTRRLLKIGAVCAFHFEFIITRIALFCILDNIDNDTNKLEVQIMLQYWKNVCTKVK